jgi:hypothetical protein
VHHGVAGAIATDGEHRLALPEIENGNDFHRGKL